MTTMITEVYEALKEANVSDAKAIAAATAIPSKENLATKEDLLQFRNEVKEEVGNLHQDMLKMEAKLDRRMDFLETKIDRLKNDLVLKLGSLMVVGFGTLAILMKVL